MNGGKKCPAKNRPAKNRPANKKQKKLVELFYRRILVPVEKLVVVFIDVFLLVVLTLSQISA